MVNIINELVKRVEKKKNVQNLIKHFKIDNFCFVFL